MSGRRFTALFLLALLLAAACDRQSRSYGPVTYAALGASDTVGIGSQIPERDAWPARLYRRFPEGSEFVRLGVSGSLVKQAVSEQLPKAIEAEPDLATVWLAVNDFNGLVDVREYEKDLTKILADLRKKGARVFVGNVPDLSKVPVYSGVPPELLMSRVDEWNKVIARVAKKNDAVLVDLFGPSQALVERGGSLISADGFHPSDEGYELIANEFWEAVRTDEEIGPAVTRRAA